MNAELSALRAFLRERERLFVVTGAGISAPSGIDTYRDHAGEWHKPQPIQHQDFLSRAASRRRYWARSMRGWPSFQRAQPNAAHSALCALERRGRLECLVTQNVDGLHQAAGQERLIELHGSLAWVSCMSCGARYERAHVQQWLERHNSFLLETDAEPRPDGDADLGGLEDSERVRVPTCERCDGMLKPDVVFYGDSVPKARVAACLQALEAADGVLVVGSSLMVYSSFRFIRRARELGLPMAAINLGRTRADDAFEVKLEADCALVLPELLGAAA